MLVYGIRCAPLDLNYLGNATGANADYYLDYGLLVFNDFTTATTIKSHGRLTPSFWERVGRILAAPARVQQMDMEHPCISDEQAAVVTALRTAFPRLEAGWYHVPRVLQLPSDLPAIQVSDLS